MSLSVSLGSEARGLQADGLGRRILLRRIGHFSLILEGIFFFFFQRETKSPQTQGSEVNTEAVRRGEEREITTSCNRGKFHWVTVDREQLRNNYDWENYMNPSQGGTIREFKCYTFIHNLSNQLLLLHIDSNEL